MHNDVQIPKKSFFKQDEVCSITGVKPYILRFWETEFEEISPVISMTGQKLYEHRDVEAVLKIKNLLFEQKLSVEKARAVLKNPVIETEEVIVEQPVVETKIEIPLQKNYWDEMAAVKGRLIGIQNHIGSLKSRHNWLN